MGFKLFGVEVEVQPGFWLTAVLLRFGLLEKLNFRELFVWVAVVFVSILIHEFGHALVVQRYRAEPEISLHWLGGTTTWRRAVRLRRIDQILISLAGPFAGFFVGGVLYLLFRYVPSFNLLPEPLDGALRTLVSVNIGWGLFNLIPVLPFDGGHVLEHALGPRRARLTAAISFLAAGLIAALCLYSQQFFLVLLFAMSAVESFQRFRSEPEAPAARRAPPREEPLPQELLARLREIRHALDQERLAEAAQMANALIALSPTPPQRVLCEAHELLGWAKLLEGDLRGATEQLAQTRRFGDADPAFASAVLIAHGELRQARRLLEAARAMGDDRKEISGPLIRVLVDLGEVARAAAVALDIVDSLSEEDARKMAEIAFQNGAFEWSARLYEAIFRRNGLGEDAYGAARANAKNGNLERALDLLKRAVDAGFSDRARAWSDTALEALRNGPLETVLPRP